MRRYFSFPSLLLALVMLFPFCAGASEQTSPYWAGNVPEDLIRSAEWRLDPEDLGGLSVVSVSPSGRYIAAADRSRTNIKSRNAAGVSNPMGRLPDALYLFSRQGEHFMPYRTVPVDTDTEQELSSLLGGGATLAWNEDETRAVIAGDWSRDSSAMTGAGNYHTNLYLLEISDGSFRPLTSNSEPMEHCVLPRWAGNDTVRFVRVVSRDGWRNTFCEIDVETGSEKQLAVLFSGGGMASPVFSWQITDGQICYTLDQVSQGRPGFYTSPVGGEEGDARCLISVREDLVETNRHPYVRYGFTGHEISRDGRWACLGIFDNRILSGDIPLSDHEQKPQNDPANAVSMKTGQPWVPCHNVLLYDLEAEQLVNPFTDAALAPDRVIVTGACFAPDGLSLLCAVFGDGGPWKTSDFYRATFYQISLTDSSFPAVRVFETELASGVWFLKGIRWTDDNVLCIPTEVPPFNMVQMMQPAVFAR